MKLLIATRNANKVKELRHAFSSTGFTLVSLDEAGVPADYDVEEPAVTFEGNAIIKAMSYGRRANMLTLAEDAGVEVDALQGRPGVLSARYVPGTHEDRYRKVLAEMEGVPDGQRGAQFRAVIAIYDPAKEKIRTCEGVCRVTTLREPRGVQGFGYDPIFLFEESQKTFAELTPEEKDAVSHRGIAVRKAIDILTNDFS